MTAMRRSGRLRDAERYGWASLAAVLLDMPVAVVAGIDPAMPSLSEPAHGRDPLGLLSDPPHSRCRHLDAVGVDVFDSADPFGFAIASLAAATSAVVMFDGRQIAASSAQEALRARIRKMVAHG